MFSIIIISGEQAGHNKTSIDWSRNHFTHTLSTDMNSGIVLLENIYFFINFPQEGEQTTAKDSKVHCTIHSRRWKWATT